MFLDGLITAEQRQAGDDYAEAIARYHKTTGIPAPSPRAQSLFSVKGHEGEQTETFADRARKASNRMREPKPTSSPATTISGQPVVI